MPLRNETGEVVDMSLMVYDAATWTMEGRRLAAHWLMQQAKLIVEHADEFSSEHRMRRLHVEHSEDHDG
jgi:hypothetical protein